MVDAGLYGLFLSKTLAKNQTEKSQKLAKIAKYLGITIIVCGTILFIGEFFRK